MARRHVTEVRLDALPARVWQLWADVGSWPLWTPTVTGAEQLDSDGLAVGARYRLSQPRLRDAVWTVTTCEQEQTFGWTSGSAGVRSVATHTLSRVGEVTVVTLTFELTGPLAVPVDLLLGRLVARYVRIEAESLAARLEGRSRPALR